MQSHPSLGVMQYGRSYELFVNQTRKTKKSIRSWKAILLKMYDMLRKSAGIQLNMKSSWGVYK